MVEKGLFEVGLGGRLFGQGQIERVFLTDHQMIAAAEPAVGHVVEHWHRNVCAALGALHFDRVALGGGFVVILGVSWRAGDRRGGGSGSLGRGRKRSQGASGKVERLVGHHRRVVRGVERGPDGACDHEWDRVPDRPHSTGDEQARLGHEHTDDGLDGWSTRRRQTCAGRNSVEPDQDQRMNGSGTQRQTGDERRERRSDQRDDDPCGIHGRRSPMLLRTRTGMPGGPIGCTRWPAGVGEMEIVLVIGLLHDTHATARLAPDNNKRPTGDPCWKYGIAG